MKTFCELPGVTILNGDALECLRLLPADSVNCCITSPPYWGLRDYGADGQIGLEDTPAEYVSKLVAVFSEVRRVLEEDGTLWLNLGDSYATGGGAVGRCPGGGDQGERFLRAGMINTQPNRMPLKGFKPKDLIGIPWRVALALQDDGWWLRSDIIWAKPNPMPESVTDRPTRSHEYIFLLAKSEKYYYDHEAIKEPAVCGARGSQFDGPRDILVHPNVGRKTRPSVARGSFNGKTEEMADTGQNAFRAVTEMRNLRDVWTIGSEPYPDAHFATFPPKLIEPCVIAGCPAGGTILDPFSGAGTTGLVARKHGRKFVGIELNPGYCAMAAKRLAQEVLDFGDVLQTQPDGPLEHAGGNSAKEPLDFTVSEGVKL